MSLLVVIAKRFSRWIDAVAGTIAPLLDRLRRPCIVRVTEDKNGDLVFQPVQNLPGASSPPLRFRMVDSKLDPSLPAQLAATLAGSRMELLLQPDHFIFRQLELPNRAAEFLHGIVRAQIDRLSPWNAADAAFGWSKPSEPSADRMVITVAATSRELLRPYLRSVTGLGSQAIAVFAIPPQIDTSAGPIKIWEEGSAANSTMARARRALIFLLAAATVTASAAVGAAVFIGAQLDAQHKELERHIASLRAAKGANWSTAANTAAAARSNLMRRKHQAPPIVMVLETLSQILPDHTYVTELRVEGDKLRLVGITKDAPSLIGLIERSERFRRATFFAPTTHSPSEPGERFHIEAIIQPLAGLRS
jgi:general secretion pathway protein L